MGNGKGAGVGCWEAAGVKDEDPGCGLALLCERFRCCPPLMIAIGGSL